MVTSKELSRHALIGRIALCSLAVGAFITAPGATTASFGIGILANTTDANWSRLCGFLWRQPQVFTDPIDSAMRTAISESLDELELSYRETSTFQSFVARLSGKEDPTQIRFRLIKLSLLGDLDQASVTAIIGSGETVPGSSRPVTSAALGDAIDALFAELSHDDDTRKIQEEIQILLRTHLPELVPDRFAAKVNAITEEGRALSDALARVQHAVLLDELRFLTKTFTNAQHNKARVKLVKDLDWGTGHSDVDILIADPKRDRDKEVDLSIEVTAREIFSKHKAIVIVGSGLSGKSYLAGRLMETLPAHTIVVMPLSSDTPPSFESLRGQQTILFIDNFHETYRSLNVLAWLKALREVSDCYLIIVSRSGRRWDEVQDEAESVLRYLPSEAILKVEHISDAEKVSIGSTLGLNEDALLKFDGTIGSLRVDITARGREYAWLAAQSVGNAQGTVILDAAKVLYRLRQPRFPESLVRQVVEQVLVSSSLNNGQWERLKTMTRDSDLGTFDKANYLHVYEVHLEHPKIIQFDPLDAIPDVAEILLNTSDVRAVFYAGVAAHLDLQDEKLAITAFEHAANLGDAAAAYNLGTIHTERGSIDDAIRAYQQGITLGSGSAAFYLGILLKERGDIDDAIRAYQQGLALGKGSAAYNLGILYEEKGEIVAAIKAYKQGVGLGHGGAASNLGSLHEEMGKFAAAIKAYRQGVSLLSSNAAFNLGALLERLGYPGPAIVAYQQGVALGDGSAATNLGLLYYRQGKIGAAVTAWQRGTELDDSQSKVLLNLLSNS